MFDADTIALMSNAPSLDGVDLADLPQQLTNAYASIVAARIRLHDTETATKIPDDIAESIKVMRRLAYSHEAFVSTLHERENRAAAAFVGGAAHHVTLLAERLLGQNTRRSSLAIDSISPEVSATLLFLIAEASADAAEISKKIIIETEDAVESALLAAIKSLANGQLRQVLENSTPIPGNFLEADSGCQAVRTLYFLLLHGIRAIAATMLGVTDDCELMEADPQILFNRVKELCIEPMGQFMGQGSPIAHSVYAGPLHLASLLSSVTKDLIPSGLINIASPSGVEAWRWNNMMKEIADRRPYLWRNHRQAIAAGYLEPGISSVISFPTGAGKSTIAELKIAAALLRGVKVIFLAPTLALVDQTAKALATTFPAAEVQREREEILFDVTEEALPAISVMTPERCLAMLGFDSEAFSDVGLLVFDECHLMHPRSMDNSRRAIDAMLCVLNFTMIAPEADLLFLSAMMMNSEEISGWIQEITGRQCLSLALTWKPTRQVRGCVVYGQSEINRLNARLRNGRRQSVARTAPAALKREMTLKPFGFFCLHQTWQSQARKDYSLLPILDVPVTLAIATGTNREWYLTPNGNQVAAALAESTARQRLKTLVFTQTIPLANSASKRLSSNLGHPGCSLTESEKSQYAVALDECGGAEYLYLEVGPNGDVLSSSACHHGLLLSVERHLHESLFKRRDGINVLVATSTLAQGMNLPSEVVIIGGDSRFDSSSDTMQRLEAHELLNAAGRAGRAGDGSYGFVLVVPSKVVHFNNETNEIHDHWTDLRAIFSQSDQCLSIDDPLTALLDQIHNATESYTSEASYLLSRLPVGDQQGEVGGGDSPARAILNRSFAAYRARVQGDQAWIGTRIEAAIAARHATHEEPEVLTWAERLGAASGVPVAVIREIGDQFGGSISESATMLVWYAWFVEWLRVRPNLMPILIRRESLEKFLGTNYKKLEDDVSRGQYAFPIVIQLLERWMAGDSLADMERSHGTQEHLIGKCESAREFTLRIIPELAYIFALPNQVYRAVMADRGEIVDSPLGLSSLGPCVREGFDRVEKLALRQFHKGRLSRRAVHRQYVEIGPYVEPLAPGENFGAVIDRVGNAVRTHST